MKKLLLPLAALVVALPLTAPVVLNIQATKTRDDTVSQLCRGQHEIRENRAALNAVIAGEKYKKRPITDAEVALCKREWLQKHGG